MPGLRKNKIPAVAFKSRGRDKFQIQVPVAAGRIKLLQQFLHGRSIQFLVQNRNVHLSLFQIEIGKPAVHQRQYDLLIGFPICGAHHPLPFLSRTEQMLTVRPQPLFMKTCRISAVNPFHKHALQIGGLIKTKIRFIRLQLHS